ncbi:MAG: beta-1,6-N-acetylglucosaminyltransferase [Pseudomonadota bacterium]
MGVGFAMLAHVRLDRASDVARHLAAQGASVVVHVDPRSPERWGADEIPIVSEHTAEWGQLGMIDATWAAVTPLLSRPDVTHVCLMSGACLPLRSLEAIEAHVAACPEADFIESVPLSCDRWVQNGLSDERFTLYHPFSYTHRRGLFDISVDVQRILRVRRQLPAGLVPHLGSQWWCLRADTLRAVLEHPDRPLWDRFFRWCWIPDESYFQSLVPLVSPDGVRRPPLHIGGFGLRGRPHVLHDDHLSALEDSGGLVARKVDPDAGALYRRFLGAEGRPCGSVQPIDFGRAIRERHTEGRGILSMARVPKETKPRWTETSVPYAVLLAPDVETAASLRRSLSHRTLPVRLHGRLFAPGEPADFAKPAELYGGNLPSDPVFRDYRPAQFLSRLVWWDREERPAFWLVPEDDHPIRLHLVNDPNARLVLVGRARERLTKLRAGFPRLQGPQLPLRAWYRTVSEDRDEDVLGQLVSILSGDWTDPAQWEVPE